jgi:hypothetical protein
MGRNSSRRTAETQFRQCVRCGKLVSKTGSSMAIANGQNHPTQPGVINVYFVCLDCLPTLKLQVEMWAQEVI